MDLRDVADPAPQAESGGYRLGYDEIVLAMDYSVREARKERNAREGHALQLLVILIDGYERSMRNTLSLFTDLKDVEFMREIPHRVRDNGVEGSIACICHTQLVSLRFFATFRSEIPPSFESDAHCVGTMRIEASRRPGTPAQGLVEYTFFEAGLAQSVFTIDANRLESKIREAILQIPAELN
ncbi:MAG TPA: hypothetical protein VMF61_07325 [Candidatus Acidoferrales bacterium]|nr:hypothetical protein [Candidatus Acidoferrales bacterium]